MLIILSVQDGLEIASSVQIKVASRLGLLPPYLFAELDRLKKEVAQTGVDVISLGIGDPDLPTPLLHGDPRAEIGIIGYGSNRGPIVESQDRMARNGIATRFLELRTLWPFPEDEVRDFIADAKHVFVVENNYTGQLERLIRYVVGPLERMHRVLKYNGRPFHPGEISDAIEKHADVRPLVKV